MLSKFGTMMIALIATIIAAMIMSIKPSATRLSLRNPVSRR